MARLLENDSLELIGRYGVPVPAFEMASNAEEAAGALERLGGKAVLKALVPVGKRGKAGAVKFVTSPEEARAEGGRILSSKVGDFPVNRLLVMETLDIKREFFLSITFDPEHNCPLVMFSPEGGIEIEELVKEHAEVLFQASVDITRGFETFHGIGLAKHAGLEGNLAVQCGRSVSGLFNLFRDCDCRMVEVNPLAELADGRVVAASGVVNLDEQALFRHPELKKKVSDEEGNGWRPLTLLEKEMREIDAINSQPGTIRFGEMDGDIGFMVTGGGYGLTSLGQVLHEGGRPSCTFDITPGLNDLFEEKMCRAVKAVLSNPGLRGLVLAGNVSNFTRVDIKMAGVVRALKDSGLDFKKFPVVIRYAGPGIEEAKRMVTEVPGVEWYEADFSLEDISKRIVDLAYKRGNEEEDE